MQNIKIFFRSVINECAKIFLQKKTYVVLSFILLFILTSGGTQLNSSTNSKTWKEDTKNKISQNDKKIVEWKNEYDKETDINKKDVYTQFISELNSENTILKYAINNDIPYNVATVWKFTYSNPGLISIVFLYIIFLSSSIVSNEYSMGTIKQVLIKPIRRWRLLISKFVTILIFICFFMTFFFLTKLIIGIILFGGNGYGFGSIDIVLNNGIPIQRDVIHYTLIAYIFDIIKLIGISALAFMLSTLSRSTTLALTFSLILYLSSDLMGIFLSNYSFGKYIIFSNFNLSQYLPGNTVGINSLPLELAILVLIIHSIMFLLITSYTFEKRDAL